MAVVIAAAMSFGQPTTAPTVAPVTFDTYRFVLLAAAEDAPAATPAEAMAMQRAHLGHLRAMAEAGHLLAAGPFADQFDDRWRGMCLYDGSLSLETVTELASADPSVQAGRLEVKVMTWITQADALAFPSIEQMKRDAAAE